MAPRRKRIFSRLMTPALVFCFMLVAGKPLGAQTASLQGLVKDTSGAVVPGANVQCTNEATNVKQARKSDDGGHYFFTLLPPGSYKLTAEVAGFKTFERTGIVLEVQQAATANVELAPGDITSKVEVTGEVPRLDTVDAAEGRVVSNVSILNMPLSSRDPLVLAQLAPGVVAPGGYPPGGGMYGVNFSANGGRLSQTSVLLDGGALTVQEPNGGIQQVDFVPKVEAIQEFKVQTNSFSAEYGGSGGAIISIVSRSGTNELHGSLFDFHRRDSLTANSFFSNAQGGTLQHSRFNELGGAVGGPVYIPKVYNGRNKTFFFVNHERRIVPVGAGDETDTVPSLLEKQGDFSQTFDSQGNKITIFDPTTAHQVNGAWTRNPFPNNTLPKGQWDPVALNLMSYYPNPTGPGTTPAHLSNYFLQEPGAGHSSWYQQNIKIDHNFTDNQRISGRYSWEMGSSGTDKNLWGNCPDPSVNPAWCNTGNFMMSGGHSTNVNDPKNGVVDYTNTLGPTTVLNLRAAVTRLVMKNDIVRPSEYFNEKTLGFQGAPMQIQQPPTFTIQGYSNLGPSPWTRSMMGSDVFDFMGSLTKVMGVHTFKVGAEARFERMNYGQPGINTAAFPFCPTETMQNPNNPSSVQGSALASFILGWGNNNCQIGPTPGQSWAPTSLAAARSYFGYFHDDYRVTPRLTLNLGLRYELNLPITDRHNRLNWIDLAAPSPLADQIQVTPQIAALCPACSNLTGGYVYATPDNRSPYDADKNDFGPRFGFAYQFAPHMVVRGGYGIYYGISSAQTSEWLGQGFATNTSWLPSSDNGVHQSASLVNPFPSGIVLPTGSSLGLMEGVGGMIYGPMRSANVTPYIQQWSFSIDRELPANSVIEISYSASKGTHLGYGTMEQYADLMDPKNLSLGDQLYAPVANPFYGLVPSGSAEGGPTIPRIDLLRPYPQFTPLFIRPGPPIGNSIYHGVTVQYSKRLSRGLQLTTHYTFSKVISDSDTADVFNLGWLTSNIDPSGPPSTQNWGNLRQDRSVSELDVTHRWVTDFSYQLPVGRGQTFGTTWPRVLDWIAGGWQLNGFMTFASGPPLTPQLESGSPLENTMGQRPNLLFNPCVDGSVESKLNAYLNPAAFSRPAPYTFGNAPRTLSSCRAPGFHGADASLFKQIYLNEGRSRYFQFRAEAFNLTNTPIFAVPSTTVGASNFGVISSQANSPRVLQLALKFYF